MHAFKLSIFETPTLPSVLKPNRLYFIKNGSDASAVVTDRSGVAFSFSGSAPSIGSAIGSGTVGSILFVGTGSIIDQHPTKLFFDKTNVRLGVGTNSLTKTFHVDGTGSIQNAVFTAASNNESAWKFSGSLTARATISDTLQGVYINPTLIAGANYQKLEAVRIEPTFTPGSYNSVSPLALHVIGSTMLNTPTLNIPANYAFSMRSSTPACLYIESATAAELLMQAGGLLGGDGKLTLRAGNNNNGFLQMGTAVLRQGGTGCWAMGNTNFAPTAILDLAAATTLVASLRIRSGTAPSAPNDGDIWFDGTNIKMRVGGVTKTFTLT